VYEIILTKAALFSLENGYLVIGVSKPWRPDIQYDRLPRVQPRIKVKEENFGSIAKTLLSRLRKEFDHYLKDLDDDMKIMTIVHPIAAGLGMEYVQYLLQFFKKQTNIIYYSRRWIHYWCDKEAGNNFWKTVLKMMTDLFFEKISGELEIPNTANITNNAIITPTTEEDFLVLIMMQQQQK
jgi:hypothetical protein